MRDMVRLVLCSLMLVGCTGILGDATNGGNNGGNGGDGSGSPPQYPLADLPLPRLSHDEYLQTLHDLVTEALPSSADAVLADVMPLAVLMPADQLVTEASQKHGGFARLDQTEQQEYADVPVQRRRQARRRADEHAGARRRAVGACSSGRHVDRRRLPDRVREALRRAGAAPSAVGRRRGLLRRHRDLDAGVGDRSRPTSSP